MLWSYVDIVKLTRVEVSHFAIDAWTAIVTRKVSSAYLAGRA